MRRALLLLALATVAAAATAQSSVGYELHGFVNPHYYADSRSVVGGREDMMLFYPKPADTMAGGADLNDGWQADMLAITARMGLRVNGPDVFGAKTIAYIEGDFTGSTNATINNLRLRHAYIDMRWRNHRLLAGQYWYAMVVHEIMPMTNPLNMGSPFHCYARQPQVRYEYAQHGFEAVAVASWQLDNMSQGLLDGQPASSAQFARHSMVPELTAQLRYRTGGLLLGAAVNLKTIQPVVPDPAGRLHTSPTYSIFGSLRLGQITLKAQTLLNNSLYEGCSLGGYMMLADGAFRDWHFNTAWVDIERNGGKWRPGLLLGYAKNEDYGNTAYQYLFGRGHDIERLWRVQPRLTYDTGQRLALTAEAEYTHAAYSKAVGNLRLSLSAVYSF
ncbi:MAG: hypothetical protein IJ760_05940 [Bacteroidales bacterium]|nr:hypothetical protein [Bacteroidales bacterium]